MPEWVQPSWPQVQTISVLSPIPSQWALQYFSLSGAGQLQAGFAHFLELAITLPPGSGASPRPERSPHRGSWRTFSLGEMRNCGEGMAVPQGFAFLRLAGAAIFWRVACQELTANHVTQIRNSRRACGTGARSPDRGGQCSRLSHLHI